MGEMITIPLAEYRALRFAAEDHADLRAYDGAAAALAAGEDEAVPAEFADRMIAGESLLRAWREYRGLTQAALGEAAKVNRVQIANIEAGTRNGSIATMKRLAEVLGVAIDDLV